MATRLFPLAIIAALLITAVAAVSVPPSTSSAGAFTRATLTTPLAATNRLPTPLSAREPAQEPTGLVNGIGTTAIAGGKNICQCKGGTAYAYPNSPLSRDGYLEAQSDGSTKWVSTPGKCHQDICRATCKTDPDCTRSTVTDGKTKTVNDGKWGAETCQREEVACK